MTQIAEQRQPRHGGGEYASADDLKRAFQDHIGSLYRLSFLLTADPAQAERCLDAAADEAIKAEPVPQKSVCSRARRAIVRQALQTLQPRPGQRSPGTPPSRNAIATIQNQAGSAQPGFFARVLSLGVFERVVFVLCAIEHYSPQQCARMVGCTFGEVLAGVARALAKVERREPLLK